MSPEDIIGHLLNLLSHEEHCAITEQLAVDQVTCVIVERLRHRLTVLEVDHIHIQAPAELAGSTCQLLRRFLDENPAV